MAAATAAKKPAARKASAKKAPIPASENAPRYQVVDGTFVFSDADEHGDIRIPMRFKTKLLREVTREDLDEMGQLFALLEGIGSEDVADRLGEMDIFDTMEVVSGFFEEFEKIAEARLGESERSSK